MSLVRKQFLIVSGMMILTIISIISLFYFGFPIYYNQLKERELKKTFLNIVESLDNKSEAEIIKLIRAEDIEQKNIFFSLIDKNGVVIYPDEIDEETYKEGLEYIENEDFDQIGVWSYLIVSKEGNNFIVQGEYAFNSLSDLSNELITFYPYIILIIVLLTSLVAFVYSHLSTKRIKEISITTRKMQKLDDGIKCKISGQDEIAYLAEDINTLYDKLLSSIKDLEMEKEKAVSREKQKSEFLRITSHELKTPIASMIGLIEGMIYNVGDFKNHDVYLRKCKDILNDQSLLVQSILDATNSDMILKAKRESFRLDELISDNLNTYEVLSKVNNNNFIVDLKPAVIVANKTYILKAIKNLLDNAFRYSVPDGIIRISLENNCLTIDNEADYILSDNELEQVFNPFYRPDFSRNKKDGGSGIGLYLVRQILESHGYKYSFKNLDNKFMRFRIWVNN